MTDATLVNRLQDGAKKVLEDNHERVQEWSVEGISGNYTRPHPSQYPHLWLWDSALAALGWLALKNHRRAQEELETLLVGQGHDGFLPHICYNPDPGALALYFPGPDKWRTRSRFKFETSAITQPPLVPFCAWQVYKQTGDRAWLERVFPFYYDYLHWLWSERRALGFNLLFITHPWESGTDNSPIFDRALANVDLEWRPSVQRKDTSQVRAAQRPSDKDYEKYTYLAEWMAKSRNGEVELAQAPFRIVDPLFNALFLKSCDAWAQAAREIGDKEHRERQLDAWVEAGRSAFSALLMPGSDWYWPYDLVSSEWIETKTVHLVAPLLADAVDGDRAKLLCARFVDEFVRSVNFPVPTTAPTEKAVFNPIQYWRGPTWINTQWFVYLALWKHDREAAREISRKALQLITKALDTEQAFSEYYNPDTGAVLGAGHFTWTASLLLYWILPEVLE